MHGRGLGLEGLWTSISWITLPETNMETQKGPLKTTGLLKGGYMGFHVSLGECTIWEYAVCRDYGQKTRNKKLGCWDCFQ